MIKPLNETAKHVLSLLEQTSFSEDVRAYSGRGMSGRVCLGVEITPAPHLDNMGGDYIAYWPAAQVEEIEEWMPE